MKAAKKTAKSKPRKKRGGGEIRPLSVEGLTKQIAVKKGNVSAIARAFKVTRQAVSAYVRSHPALKPLLDEAREGIKDEVEAQFFKDCLTDDPKYQVSRHLFLKTQCKDRGYVEKTETELTGPGGGPVVTEIVVEHHVGEAEDPSEEQEAAGGGRPGRPPALADAPRPVEGLALNGKVPGDPGGH